MIWFIRLSRKLREMAKRKKMKGKSARHGKAPSPYQKYEKKPYRYSQAHRDWQNKVRAGAAKSSNKYADEARESQRAH